MAPQSPSMFLCEMRSLPDPELSNRLVLLIIETQGSSCLHTPSTGSHVDAGDQDQVLMCRQQRLYGVPSLPDYLLLLLDSNLELPGVVPRSDPFLSFSSTMGCSLGWRASFHFLCSMSSSGSIAVFPLENCFPHHLRAGVLRSHGLPFILSLPWSPSVLSVRRFVIVLSLSVSGSSSCTARGILTSFPCPESPCLVHLPPSVIHSLHDFRMSTNHSELPLPLQNMDGRDVKPCRDLSVLSRNVEYRLSLNCSCFFLSTTHLDVIIFHLSNELRSNLIRLVSENPRDSTCSPRALLPIMYGKMNKRDSSQGIWTVYMAGTQGMALDKGEPLSFRCSSMVNVSLSFGISAHP